MTWPKLENEYVDTGKIRYVVLDFPLPFHRDAMKAHVAANCAADQGKYWQMHDKIFASQPAIKPEQLRKYAQDLGLDMSAFDKCFNGTTKLAEIRNDMSKGAKMGVRGTPSFGLGYTDGTSSKVKVIRVIQGAQPYAAFKTAIDEMLSSPGKQTP